MNIPEIYYARDSAGNVYVGSSCFEYDYSLRKNNLPAIVYTLHVIYNGDTSTISWGCTTGDKKNWGYSHTKSRIRQAMNRFAKKNGDKIVEFVATMG